MRRIRLDEFSCIVSGGTLHSDTYLLRTNPSTGQQHVAWLQVEMPLNLSSRQLDWFSLHELESVRNGENDERRAPKKISKSARYPARSWRFHHAYPVHSTDETTRYRRRRIGIDIGADDASPLSRCVLSKHRPAGQVQTADQQEKRVREPIHGANQVTTLVECLNPQNRPIRRPSPTRC